jgi:malate synthase
VAHPGLVPIAKEIFDVHMKGPNQINILRDDVNGNAQDLLTLPRGRDH